MTLYHHDNRDYKVAASQAATQARDRLQDEIDKGRSTAADVIARLDAEVPNDRIFSARGMKFRPGYEVNSPQPVVLDLHKPSEDLPAPLGIHRHALTQVGQRAGVPKRFIDSLSDSRQHWAQDLLAHNFNEIYSHQDAGKRFLVRSVDEEARGFLSDSFRRLDSRPIVQRFAETAHQGFGAVPVRGHYMATRVAIKMLLPMVFEPVENEVMAYGVQISNSDYGDGALTIKAFMLRLWCTNYAITEDALRQVHLGKRLGQSIQFSKETYALDTAATVSAVADITRTLLEPPAVDKLMAGIKQAHEENISPLQVKAFLKANLTNGEAQEVTDKFSSADVELLPPGQTKWRLSNALSWFAGEQDTEADRLRMQELAGKLVKVPA